MAFVALTLVVLLVLAAAVFGYGISIYNRLVTLRERTTNAFSQIEVQLKRRYDLIPNLVETVKGYMSHERETLEAVIAARNAASAGLAAAKAHPESGQAMRELAAAEGQLMGALSRMSVVVEQYPELKANQNMAQLTEELTHTENKVAFARQAYNDAVTAYNTYKKTFPPVFVAGMTGHAENSTLLEFADSAAIQVAPKVTF